MVLRLDLLLFKCIKGITKEVCNKSPPLIKNKQCLLNIYGWKDRSYRLLSSATEPNQARLTSLPGPIPRQPPHCHRPRTGTDLASGCCLMEGMDGNIPIANIMMGHVPHACSSLARLETIVVRRVTRSLLTSSTTVTTRVF